MGQTLGEEATSSRDDRGSVLIPYSINDTRPMDDATNVLGGPLQECGRDPLTGFYRDGCCSTGPDDVGSHTVCAVVTAEFLEHQLQSGNDLVTPAYHFPGLKPGDRWCVCASRWLHAYRDGAASPVVLASTNAAALLIVPLEALREHAVDVPESPADLA